MSDDRDAVDAVMAVVPWSACPSGCGCVRANDPDARECACDGPCCMDADYYDVKVATEAAVRAAVERAMLETKASIRCAYQHVDDSPICYGDPAFMPLPPNKRPREGWCAPCVARHDLDRQRGGRASLERGW